MVGNNTDKRETLGLDSTLSHIQMWQHGVMMGLITYKEAIELLNGGKYRVVSTQAIEYP